MTRRDMMRVIATSAFCLLFAACNGKGAASPSGEDEDRDEGRNY